MMVKNNGEEVQATDYYFTSNFYLECLTSALKIVVFLIDERDIGCPCRNVEDSDGDSGQIYSASVANWRLLLGRSIRVTISLWPSFDLLSVKHRQQSRSPTGRLIWAGHFLQKYDLILEFCQKYSLRTRSFPMRMPWFLFYIRLKNWNVNFKPC